MDYLPDSDQQQIVTAFQHFLASEMPLSRLQLSPLQQGAADASLWPAMGELGWLSITQDEALGGSGLGIGEEMLLFVEAGKQLVSPLLLTSVLSARLLQAAGHTEEALAFTRGVKRAAPATPVPGNGDSYYALDSSGCDYLLVCDREAAALFTLDAAQVEPLSCIDETVGLAKVSLAGAKPFARIECSKENIHLRGIILCAALLVGISDGVKQLSVAYAQERQQFGKPIGGFQAIKHYCAEMALRSEAALSLVIQAALQYAENGNRDAARFDALAGKLMAQDAAVKNAEAAIQIHGAMGFTREMPVHLFLKRAHVLSAVFAEEGELLENLAALSTPTI